MEETDADALFHEFVHFFEVGNEDVPAAAVAVDGDGVGIIEGGGIFGPAAAVHDGMYIGQILIEIACQEQIPGVVFVGAVAMTGGAADHDDFLFVGHRQPFEANIFEINGHGRSVVHLEGQDAGATRVGLVFIGNVTHDVAVDFLDDMITASDNVILIPIGLADMGLQLFRIAGLADDLTIFLPAPIRTLVPRWARIPRPFSS